MLARVLCHSRNAQPKILRTLRLALLERTLSLPLIASMLLLFAGATTSPPAPLLGDWTTPDHSVLQVFSCDNSNLCVRIVKVGPKDEPQTDVNNPDTNQQKRALCGLTIGHGFQSDTPGHAKDGQIYDPESGKTYSAEMTQSGDQLKMHGYVGISLFGRTETWHRDPANIPAC
jgi:uncharacterized protein (DUF2147 family)